LIAVNINVRSEDIGGLPSYIIDPVSGDRPRHIVVLLHGYGADGHDLIGIGTDWAPSLPDTVFVSPNAPYPCEMSATGYQWFSLHDYTDSAMTREIEQVSPLVNTWLDTILTHFNLKDQNMILSGFSQGSMLSLYTGTHRGRACAGILGYSGRLLGNPTNHTAVPIHLIHGQADQIVPVSSWHDTKKTLEKNGYKVTGHTTPALPHGIDKNGIISGLAFIQSCFKKPVMV